MNAGLNGFDPNKNLKMLDFPLKILSNVDLVEFGI